PGRRGANFFVARDRILRDAFESAEKLDVVIEDLLEHRVLFLPGADHAAATRRVAAGEAEPAAAGRRGDAVEHVLGLGDEPGEAADLPLAPRVDRMGRAARAFQRRVVL